MSSRFAALAAGLSLAVAAPLAFAAPASADAGTSYSWVGNSQDPAADNHSWTDPRNWAPNGVPSNGDSVQIPGPTEACTATVDQVPQVALASLSVVPGYSKFGDRCFVSVTGGPISVSDSFLWSGGRIEADLTFGPNSQARIADVAREAELMGDIDVQGTLTVSDTARDLDADGDSETPLTIWRPHSLTVESGATLRTVGDNVFSYYSCCVDPGKVINRGTVELGGRLTLEKLLFAQSGNLVTPQGTKLISDGGLATAAPGSTYTGNGGWQLSHGVVGRFTGEQKLADAFRLELGTPGSSTETTTDVAGELGGTFTVSGAGVFAWYGGTLEAGVTIAHGTNFSIEGKATGNAARVLYGRDYTQRPARAVAVVNHGNMYVDGGAHFETIDQARIINAADGKLELAAGTTIASQRCCVSPDAFNNLGRLTVSGGKGSAVLRNVAFGNSGTLAVPAGRDLVVTGGARTSLRASSITGGGRLVVGTATTIVGGTSAKHARVNLGGTLDLRGATTVSGWVNVAGGSLVNRSTLSLSSGVASRLLTAGSYTQVRGAVTHLDAGPRGADSIVAGRASIDGAVVVHDARKWAPRYGARVAVVRTSKGLAFAARVTTVRGSHAPRRTHWVPSRTSRTLTLVAKKG